MTAIEPAPCHHKHADHQHGTRAAYVLDKCRCDPCRAANTRAARALRRAQLYGRWDGLTDAQPARDHIHTLTAAWVGLKQIAARSGISSGTLTKLLYGAPRPDGTRRPPARRIKPATERRLLAVTPDLADGARTPATGTRRRLQALTATGWSTSHLARRSGLDRQVLDRALHDETTLTTAGTAAAVARLYSDLWDTPPPTGTRWERSAATRARNHATRNRWAPPLAWDDETIDDPDATPTGTGHQPRDLLADVDWLLQAGESPHHIATRLDITPGGIARALARAGRHDTAARFSAAALRERRSA